MQNCKSQEIDTCRQVNIIKCCALQMSWLPENYSFVGPSSSSPPPKPRVARTGHFSVWMQDNLFSADALRALLEDPLTVSNGGRTSARGTDKFSLQSLIAAAISLNEKKKELGRAKSFVDVECIMPREHKTRWDVKLTDNWVNKMRSVNVAFAGACTIIDGIKHSDKRCKRAVVDWHVQLVYPGSPDQDVHIDDKETRGARCYYTFILPLTDNPRAGGTHFPALGHTFASYGGALCFNGTVEHAGLGNRSIQDRYFLYAAIHTGSDPNC